jgi:hypothetical protein
MSTDRLLRRSHLAHLALVEGVIRQFDDMFLTAANSRRRIQDDMRAARSREEPATDSPAVTRPRTRKGPALAHLPGRGQSTP